MNKKIANFCLVIAVSSISLLAACNTPNSKNPGPSTSQHKGGSIESSDERPARQSNDVNSKSLVQNTAVAWQQFESIMSDFGQQSSQLSEPQEISQVLKSKASELNSIVTTNVDLEVQKIVGESQALFIDTYQTIDTHMDGISALDTRVGVDAVQECINALSNSQSDNVFFQAFECAGAGLIGGTTSSILNSDERAELENRNQRKGEVIVSQFESLRSKASNVAQYLSRNYEIESRVF